MKCRLQGVLNLISLLVSTLHYGDLHCAVLI